MRKDGIAITGMGFRFPGGADDPDSFWRLLIEGRDAVREVPPDRWNVDRFYDPEPGIAGKTFSRHGGFIDAIDRFDPQFFGISPREAPYVDPQHRLLLTTAWEALEDAGQVLDFDSGPNVGVFVGVSHNDYQVIQGSPWDRTGISAHSPTGSAHSIAANRISYCLNLTGPSIAVDTACSSALTAVHLACAHIWSGLCPIALAGGVTVMITPDGFIGFSQAGMISAQGRSKAFDASADGFVRGEGAGMVVLKPLSQALADNDPIYAVIVGSAVNQDGHTNGISLPSAEAQAALVAAACRDAGVDPADIGYVEAHGTGTAVGDPIEANALGEALCRERSADNRLIIGSVKTNIGHLETAAGVAGLAKAALVLKHGRIPPNLHLVEPNPEIDFEALKLRVPTEAEAFPPNGKPRFVGVNSFGFGGSNAHLVLTDPPERTSAAAPDRQRSWPLVISARSESALKSTAARLADWLEQPAQSDDARLLPALVHTLGARRNHHRHRMALTASSVSEAAASLHDFAEGNDNPLARTGFLAERNAPPAIGFVMSGQGPQWWGMGRELAAMEPVFRDALDACADAMKPWAGFSLLEELARPEEETQLGRTEIAQPAIFAMQVGLAALWRSRGVDPSFLTGHSVGEVAAAHVAGALTLDQAARVVVLRGRAMESCAGLGGGMLAVGLGADEARAVAEKHDRSVGVAAFNGPRSVTLAGPNESLERICEQLEADGIFARPVRVGHAFHSPMMEPAAKMLGTELAGLAPGPTELPLFSTVTGREIDGTELTAEHWADSVRRPVQFASAIDAMADRSVDVWLEIGAHPALVRSIQECLGARGGEATVVASTRREREHQASLDAACDLHLAGVTLDFEAMTPSRAVVRLPGYAWDNESWWKEAADWREARLAPGGLGLLDARLPLARPTWITRLDRRHMAFLDDHRVFSHVVFPAAGFVDMVVEAGIQLFDGKPFVIEDLEIRKPLLVPETPGDVEIELAVDPAQRTFEISSRMGEGSGWSTHVVGAIRSERTDTRFTDASWSEPSGLAAQSLVAFYDYMAGHGLRYGTEFRPVRELFAGKGESAGRIALSEEALKRHRQYPAHPVIFDGALQVFSAGAAEIQTAGDRVRLPARFSRILYVGSPGPAARVTAKVTAINDAFLEGAIDIFDEAGNPCIRVEGFRAVTVENAHGAGHDDLVYHVGWDRQPSALPPRDIAPVPLDRLYAVGREALDEVIALRGRDYLESLIAHIDDLAAGHVARALIGMGADRPFNAETLGVAESMKRPFGRLTLAFERRGLVTRDGELFTPGRDFFSVAENAGGALRAFIRDHPGDLPEALLSEAMGADLAPILRGDKDAVQILFAGAGSDLLDQFYGDGLSTSHWLAAFARAVAAIADNRPHGRGLRILEVGAGTGGLAAQVLPALERGVHDYVFTDVTPAFFAAAGRKLAAFPEVVTRTYDLERPCTEQGFDPASFDIVLATNVIHAVSDVREALGHIRELLVPGGTLMFLEVATPQLWTESVFGLTSGWWRFSDRDLRPDQPLLERRQWEAVLAETFDDVRSLPGIHGPEGGESQIGLIARKTVGEGMAVEPAADDAVVEPKSWLVLADAGGTGDRLAERLAAAGHRCRLARIGADYSADGDRFVLGGDAPDDWRRMIAACAETPPERIVFLCGLDRASEEHLSPAADALLYLAQALGNVLPGAALRIDVVTRGAQPAGPRDLPVDVGAAAVIGLMRVVQTEYPSLRCRNVDLAAAGSAIDDDLLWLELNADSKEREVAYRGEARYVQRIRRRLDRPETLQPPSVPLRLDTGERGLLDALRFVPFALPACGPKDVIVDVKAAGMNFRDVLKALGLYPSETADARVFGDEMAGVVVSVGDDVTDLKPGDRVFGITMSGIATRARSRADDLRVIPDGLSFEQAATIPVVFMTALHALKYVARIQANETVLVHAGAGGVGMAAIQIAMHLGAEVIATAGSPVKRHLLNALGVDRVVDSRRADFVEAVMDLTGGRGVDVVLNSLAAEAIPMGLACLAPFGRFVEIGKRDIYENARVPLRPLRSNASFHVVAMDEIFNSPASGAAAALLAEIADLLDRRVLAPLPFRSFPAASVEGAFRLIAQGKHIGKVVIAFAEPMIVRRAASLTNPFVVDPSASYLITGGFGGFGRVLAAWLAESGARRLVMTGRSGASSAEAKAFLETMQARGVAVEALAADISDADDVDRIMAAVDAGGMPLKGVFHLAMVLDDAPISELTPARMRAVFDPKARGAWLLHEATRGRALDCFVMFSSASAVLGNAGQGNYAAANAALDALAHHRRALGLPGLSVNWGALGGTGYVSRNERVADFLARQGTTALSPAEVVSCLKAFLDAGAAQALAVRIDWQKWRQFFRGMQDSPLLESVFAGGFDDEDRGAASDWRARIDAAAPAEREQVVADAVRDIVGSVLRVKPESLRLDQPLTDLGLDSLMAVETENLIESSIGVSLPPSSLMRARTIGQIVNLLDEHMASGAAARSAPASTDQSPAANGDGALDVDALSDEDIEALLGDVSAIGTARSDERAGP